MTCCEVEFLAVGSGSKPGDAIIVRYGEPHAYDLMVVDGGNADTGQDLVDHLRRFFPNRSLRHIVLTHSDADHASGLRTLLAQVRVENLWLHVPWLLAEEARHLFKDKRWTSEGLSNAIKEQYDIVREIVDLALAQGTNIFYPFAGSSIGPFMVLSPTRYAYTHLLPQFDKTPDPDRDALQAARMWLGKGPSLLERLLQEAIARVQEWISDTWEFEQLRDGGTTSASNETSVVLYGRVGDRRILLTGDAGVEALTWAANFAEANALQLRDFDVVQIPHHGSRRNVGPSILNRIIGPVMPLGITTKLHAYVSAPKDDSTHPRKMVLNAFIRRGARVYATQGQNKVYFGGFPLRDGYTFVDPLPFSSQVEAYA